MLLRLRQPLLVFVDWFIMIFLLRLGCGLWSEPNKPLLLYRGNTLAEANWKFCKGIKNYASYKRKPAVSV